MWVPPRLICHISLVHDPWRWVNPIITTAFVQVIGASGRVVFLAAQARALLRVGFAHFHLTLLELLELFQTFSRGHGYILHLLTFSLLHHPRFLLLLLLQLLVILTQHLEAQPSGLLATVGLRDGPTSTRVTIYILLLIRSGRRLDIPPIST